MIIHFLTLILAFALVATPVNAQDEYVIYTNIENSSLSLVVTKSLGKAALNDVITPIKKCEFNSCLLIEDILIAKPKPGEVKTYFGANVENLGTEKIYFLDESLTVDVVITEVNGIKQKYFFSENKGLIGFKLTTENSSAFFLLRGKIGIWPQEN